LSQIYLQTNSTSGDNFVLQHLSKVVLATIAPLLKR